MDSAALLRAAAANHRAWFRRTAAVSGGRAEWVGGVDMTVDGWGATIAFPRSRRVGAAVGRIRELGLRNASCWSLAADPELGTRLVARGFGWGWQPHWMALELARLPADDTHHHVVVRRGPIPGDVPYGGGETDPPAAVHLAVRADGGAIVGHAVVNPWRGVAGIYSMGVSPAHRRQGIGRALTLASGRAAAKLGCSHAVLNATDEGERLYRSVGFGSLGWGQTWWYRAGRDPTPRQTALAEAIGFGDLPALETLRPSRAELVRRLPGGTSPMRLALVTGRLDTAAWLLDRAPALANRRLEPFGGSLLHLAVEHDRADFVRLALVHGASTTLRDHTWDATPLGWAEHFERPELASLLEPNRPTPS
jgi:ribosomal protein S18 acetylase RimI-like enzyme